MISFKRLGGGGGGGDSGAIAWGMNFFRRFSALPGTPVVKCLWQLPSVNLPVFYLPHGSLLSCAEVPNFPKKLKWSSTVCFLPSVEPLRRRVQGSRQISHQHLCSY